MGWPAQHHVGLEVCCIRTDGLAEPAVPVTGEPALVCASVGETHGQVCPLGTGQKGKCCKRELEGRIGLFGPITKGTDKHLASKWLLWSKQLLPPSCLSSPSHTGLATEITDSHLSAEAADSLASEAGKCRPALILPFSLKHLAPAGKGCSLRQAGRNKELAA